MKKSLLFLYFAFHAFLGMAQQRASVGGLLLDSLAQKTTINFATVSVFKEGDSVLTTYKLSDDKGVFRITNLQAGIRYRLVINAWQYQVRRQEFVIPSDQSHLDLGKIYLSERTNELDEVTILAERPPIIVRKDTIEFNAESFKTLPTAVVEDLLKKLPGVAVADDGSIQVNGKSVSKILVDGKEFFGGDQQIATKNLPANIIDKIQVTDDQEAKRRDPDILAGNVPQVINLKLKKAIKSGAFGKLFAGGGANERFEAGGIMNFFRDTTQVSLLSYGNNVNRPGFNIGDVSRIGGFSRSGINSVMINSDGGFSLNNISFGGSAGGVQQSAGAGANFNTLTKGGTKINAKYFFGQSNNRTEQWRDVDQTLGQGHLFTTTYSANVAKSYNHNLSAKVEWAIDSLTKLTIEPSLSFSTNRNSGLTNSLNARGPQDVLNEGRTDNSLYRNRDEYLMTANFWKDFKKAGRYISVSMNVGQTINNSDNYTVSSLSYYQPPSEFALDQLRDNDIRNFNVYLSANAAEPISKALSINVNSNANYINNENALFSFLKNPANQQYDLVVPNASETVIQRGYKSNTRLSLKWKVSNDLNIQPGVVFNTIDLENGFSRYPNFEQHFQFFAPQLIVRYKTLNLSYSPSFREPDVRYIQPVADNSNPLFIQNGNAQLRPSRTHQVNLHTYKYDTKRSLNYNANLSGSVQNDGVIMSRIIEADGRQVSTPINIDGVWQFHANATISKDFKNDKRQITLGTGFWSNYNRNMVEINKVRSLAQILTFSPRISGRLNFNDKLEFRQSYDLAINTSSYEDAYFTNLNYLTHSSETEVIVRLPKRWVWETNYRIQYNDQTVAGFSNKVQIWNAALTFLFMKNDRAQLKFGINDILNTNTRRYLSISENAIRDTRTNNLGRHGLVTLTYNIQNFGGKVGGRETLFRF